MAEQPAVLTINRKIDRPSPSSYEKFNGLPIGNIIDAQGRSGAIDYRIKPITSMHRFIGPVLTIDAGPRDNLAAWMALEHIKPGDLLMIATGGHDQSSVIGDLWAVRCSLWEFPAIHLKRMGQGVSVCRWCLAVFSSHQEISPAPTLTELPWSARTGLNRWC